MTNYDEIAQSYDRLKDAGTELDGLVPVRARISKDARAVFSLRLSREELRSIAAAAKKRGLSVSDFLRQAGLAAATEDMDLDADGQAALLRRVREQVRALADTVEGVS